MGLEDIKEVRQVKSDKEANELLRGGWKLLEVKTEKVKLPSGKEWVGTDKPGLFAGPYTRYEVTYSERLTALYILGR